MKRMTIILAALLVLLLATFTLPATAVSVEKIFFNANMGSDYEIYAMNTDGSNLRDITNNPAFDNDFSISPDGSKISFMSNRDGNYDIYVMNSDGSGVKNLSNNTAHNKNPVWSPDGAKIAFVSDMNGNLDIFVMNSDGSDLKELFAQPCVDTSLSWFPDSTKIAFTSSRDPPHYYDNVYIMNADGSEQKRLTYGEPLDMFRTPTWSPDGSQIAFVKSNGGQYYMGAVTTEGMNTDGTGAIWFVPTDIYAGTPVWSPDGSKIAFVAGDINDEGRHLHVLNLADLSVAQLTNDVADNSGPVWSPDGSKIAFASDKQPTTMGYNEKDAAVYTINLADLSIVQLTDSGDWYIWDKAWCMVPDNKPPVTHSSVDGSLVHGQAGDWYITKPLVTLSGDDGPVGTGLARIDYVIDNGEVKTYSGPFSIPVGKHWIAYQGIDNAGNIETAHVEYINVDLTSPVTTLEVVDGTPGTNDWYISGNVKVALHADDVGGSGVARTEWKVSTSAFDDPAASYSTPWSVYAGEITFGEDPIQLYLLYRSVDNAGNIESTKAWPIQVDTGVPYAEFTTPNIGVVSVEHNGDTRTDGVIATYQLNQPVVADYYIEDPGANSHRCSGVNTGSLTATVLNGQLIDTSNVGAKAFTLEVKDNAGNTLRYTAQYQVVYSFPEPPQLIPKPSLSGIPPAYNLGANVPVSFKLADALGSYVTNAKALLYVAPVTNGVVGLEQKATPNGKSNKDNIFRYDPIDHQYIYNLNTKTFKPGIYQLRVVFGDGTSQTTTIQIVK